MNETLILEIIFWSALFMVFYTYLGYGIVLYALVRLKELCVKPVKRVRGRRGGRGGRKVGEQPRPGLPCGQTPHRLCDGRKR